MTELSKVQDQDPEETREWLESIDSVIRTGGGDRAHFLLERLIDHARRSGAYLPFKPNTAYVNTIPVGQEPPYPGDRAIEKLAQRHTPGAPVSLNVIGGFTDCNAFRARGKTCYGFLPLRIRLDELERIHGKDERISLEVASQGVLQLHALLGLLGE